MNTNLSNLTKELCFSIDNYKKPKVLEGMDAKTSMLMKLLYLKPGNYPSIPNMGIDILSYKFEFFTEELIVKIKDSITEQVSLYIPDLYINDIILKPYKGYLIIAIQQHDNETNIAKNIGLIINKDPTLSRVLAN